MTKKIVLTMATMTGMAMLVSGCSSFDEALGETKKAPDEFQVVVRPPLTLPPNFQLSPENDTEIAPNTGSDAVSTAEKLLTASTDGDASIFDGVFGTDQRISNIRQLVDEETLGIQIERRLPIEILFGGQPNVGPNLNAAAEALRIRKALARGEDPTATPTPAIDPVDGTDLTVE